MKQSKIFKHTLDWIQDRIDNGLLDNIAMSVIERQAGLFKEEVREYLEKTRGDKKYTSDLKKRYYGYLKKDVFERNKDLKGYRLKDLSPKFQRELKRRTKLSLALIKNRNNQLMSVLNDRFINWLTVPSQDVRGANPSPNTFLRFLGFSKESVKSERQIQFILTDQSRKMREAMDSIIREELGAIGGFWQGVRDSREVGNPNGLYPKGNKAHGDHWKREGKFYIFKDSWAYKRGLVKGELYEDLEDGGAGVAIGCRCWLRAVYDIRDVPKEFITMKGAEYIERNTK